MHGVPEYNYIQAANEINMKKGASDQLKLSKMFFETKLIIAPPNDDV